VISRLRAGVRAFARGAAVRPDVAIGLIGSLMLIAYLSMQIARPRPGGRVVVGDATHHFVQLRSMVFDRDLDFRNEYVRLYDLRGGEPGTEWVTRDLTPTGHVRNYMPVGPAMLWAPLYLILVGVLSVRAMLGLGPWPDGFERALQMTPGASGVVAATVGVWLSWRLARRFTDAPSAATATLAMWLGSSAIYYALVSPAYSHAASMLVSSLFFLVWASTRNRPTPARFALWGALAGLASLMRWQDALLLAVPAIEALHWPVRWPRRMQALVVTALAWTFVFTPQMAVWWVLYGQPFAVPQGPSFLQWTRPHPIDVLFSDNHGLFTWTPLVVLSVIGLARFAGRHRSLAPTLAVVVLTSWYVNAAVADWWAGEAFGARRFLSLFPLFTLGLAVFIDAGLGVGADTARAGAVGAGTVGTDPIGADTARRGWTLRAAAAWALVAANLLLLLQYQLFMKGLTAIAPYPRNWFDMWAARFVVPFRLLDWWWR
jgi:hypothetical protein